MVTDDRWKIPEGYEVPWDQINVSISVSEDSIQDNQDKKVVD